MAKQEETFVGIDIGSSKISVVVGKREEDGTLSVIGVGNSFVTGVKKGVITEIEETVSGISEAVEIAERTSGIPIDLANININGSHISSVNSNGVIAVGRADQEITKNDVARAEDAASAVQIPANKEIIHVIPRHFVVDGGEAVKDPLGMTGVRLELEAHLVTVSTQASRAINKCVSQAGIKIGDIIVSPLAAAKAVLDKNQRDLGCVMIDIGATTTGITIFVDDAIAYSTVMSVGSAHITNDIAIGLRTSIEVAEKVKLKYGSTYVSEVPEKDKIDLSAIDIKEEGIVTRRYVAEIIEARVEEIFKRVKEEMSKIGDSSMFPAGIILTGGGAKLSGLDALAKEVFDLPAEIGKPHALSGLTDKVYDPRMSAVVGLMLYAFEEKSNVGGSSVIPEIVTRIKKMIKVFLP